MTSHDDIPDNLVEALRTAAATMPAHFGDLVDVQRRGRDHRRRRSAGVTLAAVAAAVAIAVPAVSAGMLSPQPQPPPAATTGPASVEPDRPDRAATPTPAQRLLLDPRSRVASYYWPEEFRGYQVVGEVLPDGRIVSFDLRQLDALVLEVVPVRDGRLVVRGTADLSGDPDGRHHTEGPCWSSGTAMRLFVLAPDGSVELTRDLSVGCEPVSLVHADQGAAYLLRGSRLVAHDLATGAEHVVADLAEIFGPQPEPYIGTGYLPPWPVALTGYRVATVGRASDQSCAEHTVEVSDLAGSAPSSYPLPEPEGSAPGRPACVAGVLALRLSPDGRYAALAYEHPASANPATQVAVVDMTTGRWVAQADRPGHMRGALPGMAWRDETTLQVAWPAPYASDASDIEDFIELETVTVP